MSTFVWYGWLLYGALVLCAPGQHVVRAQFVANPLPLNSTYAQIFNGMVDGDQAGYSVSGVGDMNGDGMDDFVVGAPFADPFNATRSGQVFLLFGRNASTNWTSNPFELSALNDTHGVNGVLLYGSAEEDRVGSSVSGVNDVNGDNINDMLLGTQFGDVAYLVFGVNGTWPGAVNLTQGAFNGVTFVGQPDKGTGSSVSGAGDVNNDGVHDFVIGTRLADTPGGSDAGRVDVLYGRSSGSSWPAVVNLTTYVNATTGFSVLGNNATGNCGTAVSGVGDVSGDGVDDVALGCPRSDPGEAGSVAVVFGSSSALPMEITPSELNGTNGFVVYGQRSEDRIGQALCPVGDVNADGLYDFAIGAFSADANALTDSGEMYVLFGRNASVSPWAEQLDVSSLNGNNGFILSGARERDRLGHSVSAAGDVDGDGIDDLLVGAYGGGGEPGVAFLLYGREVWQPRLNSSDMNAGTSHTFQGNAIGDSCGFSVSHVGDVNGDGRGDLAIGCSNAAGRTAIVFGPLFTPTPTAAPTTTPPTTAPPTTPPTMAASTTAPPTTAPTTAAPTFASTQSTAPTPMAPSTSSPTPPTCATQGTFVPPEAGCVNGVLTTAANTTAPAGTSVTVSTSVTVTGGASFQQPSGSTLVFVVGISGTSTSISVEGGGCAAIGGDAVVSFASDPSNGGGGNTGPLLLVTADCVTGAFGAVSATTSFEGDECVAIGDGVQEAGGSSISVSFGVSNTCDGKSSGLSAGVLAAVIAGSAVVVAVLVVAAVKLGMRARNRRAVADVKMMRQKAGQTW